jgi:hypothetical protein
VAPGCADAAAVQRVAPLLQAHGRLLPPLDSPTKACMFKLAGNFSLFGFVEVLCEVSARRAWQVWHDGVHGCIQKAWTDASAYACCT